MFRYILPIAATLTKNKASIEIAQKMDAYFAALMADKREIIFAPTVYKFDAFAAMAEEFKLNERDVVLTNEFIYAPFMKDLNLKCQYVFQEKLGIGEPSEEMIQVMYDAILYDSYDRVIAVGGSAIMDLCKLLGCDAKDTIPELNALLQWILPLRPLRDCGFTEEDFKKFPPVRGGQPAAPDDQRLLSLRPGVRRSDLPQVLLRRTR